MKKYLTIFIAILLLVMLVSCGNDSNDTSAPNAGADSAAESERTIITLGIAEIFGVSNVQDIMWHVMRFNAESRDYRIEVINYTEDDLMRLRTELITGTGPDIIYSLFYDDTFFDPLKAQGILADLWPFIDADPDINREDFFINILEAAQSPDGSLQLIAKQFYIETLISLPGIVDYPESFTSAEFLNLIRNAFDAGMSYPMGVLSGREFLSRTLSSIDFGIIDIDAGVSNFESQVFLDLLRIASLLPSEEAVIEALRDPNFHLFAQMARGEQIFRSELISTPGFFSYNRSITGDFTILGFPSDEGSIHGATMVKNLGLNTNSDNPDGAWSFIRRFLLPPPPELLQYDIPIRIDSFEDQVRDAMRAEYFTTTEDGEIIGMAGWNTFVAGIEVPVRSLTAEDAEELRKLIESISFVARFDSIIINIVMEEVAPFLAGTRTAEETARVIQSRVQMYLHERS